MNKQEFENRLRSIQEDIEELEQTLDNELLLASKKQLPEWFKPSKDLSKLKFPEPAKCISCKYLGKKGKCENIEARTRGSVDIVTFIESFGCIYHSDYERAVNNARSITHHLF